MVNRNYLAVLLALSMISPSVMAASQAESLFQEAVVKETGERNPEAAVELYRQVIDQAGGDHRLVAKARLHMGTCLERLGKPKEAEEVYLEIIQDSAASLTEAVQAAQANLQKLEAQEKKAVEEAELRKAALAKPMVLVREFHDTRFSLVAGPGLVLSGKEAMGEGSVGIRYRLSPLTRPLALWAEVGGLFPFGTKTNTQSKPFQSQIDTASLKLRYQMHISLIADLPHGVQKKVIPQIGAGFALTSSKIDYLNGSSTESTWSPRLSAGLHIHPEKIVSFLIEGSYTANPYNKTVQIPAPAHNQTFDFPKSLWNITAQIQIKIGRYKTSLRPKE